jgi:predicted DNA-binding transcriptional regulator AlpA
MSEKILMRAKEAAAFLDIGKTTLWNNVKKGEVPPPIKIGGATRWRVSDLVALVANAPTIPSTPAA